MLKTRNGPPRDTAGRNRFSRHSHDQGNRTNVPPYSEVERRASVVSPKRADLHSRRTDRREHGQGTRRHGPIIITGSYTLPYARRDRLQSGHAA